MFDFDGNACLYFSGFHKPAGIAVHDLRLFVTEPGENRVAKCCEVKGKFSYWGGAGNGPGQLKGPQGIAILGKDVFVADTGNDRIVKYDFDGNTLAYWGGSDPGKGFRVSMA